MAVKLTLLFCALFGLCFTLPTLRFDVKQLNQLARYARLRESYPNFGVSEKDFDIKCFSCRLFVDSIHWVWGKNVTQDCLIELATAVCEYLHIEDNYICEMITSEFKEEMLYVLGKVIVEPNQICGLLLNGCGGPFDPLTNNWTVSLPHNKPPVQKLKLPPADAPKLRVLHLSDIHIDPLYQPGSEVDCGEPLCCRYKPSNGTVKRPAGFWGTVANCDIPYRTLESLLEHVTSTEKFDYVLWTGDLEPHNVWHYTKSNHLNMLTNLTTLFLQYFPKTPVFSAVGNHEGVPMDSFPPHNLGTEKFNTAWLYDTLANQWTNWISNGTRAGIKWRASYVIFPFPGFRIISLNTQYCDRLNFWLYINQTDPDSALAWLTQELLEAEQAGDKVHIIGHVPSGEDYCFETWSRNYYSIINRFESTIRGQFFGHTHQDSFAVFYDQFSSNSRATNMMYVTPSVTSFGLGQGVQPSYRVYTIDGSYKHSTWSVLDAETYVMDIDEANKLGKPQWKLEYKAKDAYKMANLFPQEWSNVIDRLDKDEKMLKNYIRFHYRLSPAAAANYDCDWLCRYNALCELRSGMPEHEQQFCSDLQRNVWPHFKQFQIEHSQHVKQRLAELKKPNLFVQKILFEKCHL